MAGTSQIADVAELPGKGDTAVLGIDNISMARRKGNGPAGEPETMQRGSTRKCRRSTCGRGVRWGNDAAGRVALDYPFARRQPGAPRRQGRAGSTRAWWLGAIDDRVKAVVGVACFTRYEDLIAIRQLKAHGIYYFVPGILKHFDSEGVMALLAPRPFLALTGDRDAGSPPEGMKKLEQILGKVYKLYGKPESFRSIIYSETGHVYNDDEKQKMIDWFNRYLGGGQS